MSRHNVLIAECIAADIQRAAAELNSAAILYETVVRGERYVTSDLVRDGLRKKLAKMIQLCETASNELGKQGEHT